MKVLILILVLLSSSTSLASETCAQTVTEGNNETLSRLMNGWQRMYWNFDAVSSKIRMANTTGEELVFSEAETKKLLKTIRAFRGGVLLAAEKSNSYLAPSIVENLEGFELELFYEVYNQSFEDFAFWLRELEEVVTEERWGDFEDVIMEMRSLMVNSHRRFTGITPKYD